MTRCLSGNSGTDASAEQDVWLLALFHYALAALTGLFAVVGVPLVIHGNGLLNSPPPAPSAAIGDSPSDLDTLAWGTVFVITGVAVIALCLVHAAVVAYIGRQLARHRRRRLVLVFSVLHTLNIPLGTALSIYTLVLLFQPRVRALFTRV